MLKKEWLEVNRNFDIVDSIVNTDRNTENPFIIEFSEGVSKSCNNNRVNWCFFELGKVESSIFWSFSDNEDRFNLSIVVLISFSTIIFRIIRFIFELSINILKIESENPSSLKRPLPASMKRISLDSIPVRLNNNIQSKWNFRVFLSPVDTDLNIALFFISTGRVTRILRISNLNSSGCFFLRWSNCNGESIESSQAKSSVSASMNRIWLIERIKSKVLFKSDSVPSESNLGNLDLNSWIYVI